MSQRITERMLENRLDTIRRLLGRTQPPYSQDDTGKWTANLGALHLDGAYGGWSVTEIVTEGGGVHQWTAGHIPARDLFTGLGIAIEALRLTKEDA